MERLTYRDKDGFPMMKKRGGFKQRGVERLAAYEDTGLEPEEINDLASVREISPEAEYAINKHADNIIERLDKLLHQTDDDARLRELAKAGQGRAAGDAAVQGGRYGLLGAWCGHHRVQSASDSEKSE